MSTLFNALKDFAFENAVPLLTGLFLLIAAVAWFASRIRPKTVATEE